jgi:Phosphopantetheine attachment site.
VPFVITERVKAVIANQFDVEEEEITSEMTFSELGADPLDIAELVDALADEFDCDIPVSCADSIETVGDAIKCVKKYLRQV